MKHSHIIHHYWTSPCGILDLASIGEELVMCDWVDGWHRAATLNRLTRLTKLPMVEDASSVIDLAQVQLAEYFDQRRQVFTVPLRLIGSEFQTHVWHALTKIPYGKTISYGEIAREVNSPKAVRAVGGAVGANPLSIIIPCHRVVGANGSITGYGGGYAAKRRLLALELGLAADETRWDWGLAADELPFSRGVKE